MLARNVITSFTDNSSIYRAVVESASFAEFTFILAWSMEIFKLSMKHFRFLFLCFKPCFKLLHFFT